MFLKKVFRLVKAQNLENKLKKLKKQKKMFSTSKQGVVKQKKGQQARPKAKGAAAETR
jgi:hypothetical protein